MVNQTAAHIKKLPLAKMAEHGPALYEELDKVIKELANNGSKFDSKVSEMVTNLNIAAMSAATATQLQHLTMGSTMTDKGFVSTSSSANEAKKFAGADGALMEIRVKKGQPAM